MWETERRPARNLKVALLSLAVAFHAPNISEAFANLPRPLQTKPFVSSRRLVHRHYATQQEEHMTTSVVEEAARLKKEAELMRLQAEQMDLSLTLQKIEALEAKLKNKTWLAKHPDQEAEFRAQLQRLNDKLTVGDGGGSDVSSKLDTTKPFGSSSTLSSSAPKSEEKRTYSSKSYEPSPGNQKNKIPISPVTGFDQEDLDLYIPIANDINKSMPNATIDEKLKAFRAAPELQEHFQKKIQNMLVGPLEDLQRLEQLRQDFLDSTSSVEREQLKRDIERLEKNMENDTPFVSCDGLILEGLPPLSEEELERRAKAVGDLPEILVAIYKQRNSLDQDADLNLAIQMDYYEPQIQLMEQVRMFDPLPDDMREDYYKAFSSLPKPVQERIAGNAGIDQSSDAKAVLEAVLNTSSISSPFMEVVKASNVNEPDEYNDIEFVDRSRFLKEFFPAIANLEDIRPSEEDVETFANAILDKKTFMVTSKPERVFGGYYIRGSNLLVDDEDGKMTGADKMVATISEKLAKSQLSDKLDFYYILDPSPPTDEEMEMGPSERPILVVTAKDPQKFYAWVRPRTKLGVSLLGLITMFLFSVGACALNPAITDRFYSTLDKASETGVIELQWFNELYVPIFTTLLAIQFAHELAHKAIAFRDQFDIGLPTIVPSITTGLTGAITPFKSPPPNSKSMFDFALAGPLVGMVVSLGFLLNGLDQTAHVTLGTQLPVIPVDILRSSSLGGGLVSFFLGNTAVLPDQGPSALLPLHPYAIAGFIGLLTNALALLPLGHTDGGRISLTMFGRRGGFVVNVMTSLLLVASGLFGFDETYMFLAYTLVMLVWQREPESPARNEVDELDFPRALIGIVTALAVGLTLIPMF